MRRRRGAGRGLGRGAIVLGQWLGWWAVVTAALWGLAAATGSAGRLRRLAAGAACVIVMGECGDRLRRRWAGRGPARRRGA